MDAIELARQRACELHNQLVASGHDPWSPYEFALAAAKARDLKVEKCAPGAAVLDGGPAIFESQYKLITHERRSSMFEQAFFVAHEIGHSELGDDKEDEPAFESDPARSSEAAPAGMDRVVDYSRRQRREVQMDLFARELLLPRPVARKLHLDKALTCSEIANKLGAPFEVIAQQMFDALLLPAMTPAKIQAPSAIPLNKKQQDAVDHRGSAYLLQAGPGTGKTRTLVARVESLLDEGIDPRRILLLTFSNKAAGEMAERIAKTRPADAAALWVGTFHGFGLDLLRRFNDLFGLPTNPKLMDRAEAVELLENEFPRLGLKHYRNIYDPSQIVSDMLGAISRAKDEVVNASHYLQLAQVMRKDAVSSADIDAAENAIEVAKFYAAYEVLKAQKDSVDFGDLVMRPVLLLEENEALRHHLQERYDHILVDEYQDVNRSGVRLLSAMKPDGTNLWVVGDVKQSIYRFRGASSFNVARFGREDFPEGISNSLEINYRSTPEIVKAFSTFSASMKVGGARSGLQADRSSIGFDPEVRTVREGDLMTPALVDCIEQLRASGTPYRDQAVLRRGNDKLSDLAQELERAGVPVLFLGSLFERAEVKDLLAVLSLMVDGRAMGLLRTACWSEFAMPMEDIVSVFEQLKVQEADPGAWKTEVTGLTEGGTSALKRLGSALEGCDSSSSPWRMLAVFLLDRTRMLADLASSGTVAAQGRGMGIWQFMNFVKVQPSGQGLPITRLLERVRRLLRLRDDRDLRQLPAAAQGIDAVRLMTVHGSKGLEFPAVHVVGVNHDTIPGNFRGEACPPPSGMVAGAHGAAETIARAAHSEEQECLFYVAMSRARNRLFFYGADYKSDGVRRKLSDFISRLGTVVVRSTTPKTAIPSAPDKNPILIDFIGNARFSSDAMALYQSCPRRFLYTHLLQVGGRRRTSAFMQMHEAVRVVYREIVTASGSLSEPWESMLDSAFAQQGLNEHGYADDYRSIAKEMLNFFLASRVGAQIKKPSTLCISFNNDEIEVRPDEILVRNGIHVLRRVKTGHSRSTDHNDTGAAAFILAAQQHFPGAKVEIVYLADGKSTQLNLSLRELGGREVKLHTMFADIRSGMFPAKKSEFSCPGCPAFFVCGATPPGTLTKSF